MRCGLTALSDWVNRLRCPYWLAIGHSRSHSGVDRTAVRARLCVRPDHSMIDVPTLETGFSRHAFPSLTHSVICRVDHRGQGIPFVGDDVGITSKRNTAQLASHHRHKRSAPTLPASSQQRFLWPARHASPGYGTICLSCGKCAPRCAATRNAQSLTHTPPGPMVSLPAMDPTRS